MGILNNFMFYKGFRSSKRIQAITQNIDILSRKFDITTVIIVYLYSHRISKAHNTIKKRNLENNLSKRIPYNFQTFSGWSLR